MFAIYLEPFLNKNTYQTIITVDYPEGPIQSRISRINAPSLSPFQTVSQCTYVLTKENGYMTKEDIPEVFSYLVKNGYTIETSLTKLLQPITKTGNRTMICMVKYQD
jgi:K+ transporter